MQPWKYFKHFNEIQKTVVWNPPIQINMDFNEKKISEIDEREKKNV